MPSAADCSYHIAERGNEWIDVDATPYYGGYKEVIFIESPQQKAQQHVKVFWQICLHHHGIE
ncbi:hypothetical protein [Pontibacter sp. BT731]|uniref:hypothetical protein n=1 Tax=Pontibacter coccineus TaxID=3063328 RepID=UPI0026E3D771|nr:hypothetical protein [Pontibacter sp. BT731]